MPKYEYVSVHRNQKVRQLVRRLNELADEGFRVVPVPFSRVVLLERVVDDGAGATQDAGAAQQEYRVT